MGLIFKWLFSPVLFIFGLNRKEQTFLAAPADLEEDIVGTHGLIEADGVIGCEDDKIALIIDYELADVPVWVEWDVDLKQISVAQSGGAVAILKTVLSEKEARDFESTDKLLLCTNVGEERVVQTLPLILRNCNDNREPEVDSLADMGQELAFGAK